MRRASTKTPLISLLSLVLTMAMIFPLYSPPAATAAGEYEWVDARGPGNGDAMALAVDNVRGIVYRATVGHAGGVQSGKGVWKYQAGKWTSLGGEVASLGIWNLAYDEVGDRLYAGSYGQGIWCYNPSDGTWAETDYAMRSYDVTALAFGGGKLYAGLRSRSPIAGKGVWCYYPANPSGGFTDTGGGVKDYVIRSLAWGGGRLYAGPEDIVSHQVKGVWYYDPASPNPDKWTDTGGGMAGRLARVLAWDGENDLLYASCWYDFLGTYDGVWYHDPASPDANKWGTPTAMWRNISSPPWSTTRSCTASTRAPEGRGYGTTAPCRISIHWTQLRVVRAPR